MFRQGSNFLKLCVLRVCQQSERHLDKVQRVIILWISPPPSIKSNLYLFYLYMSKGIIHLEHNHLLSTHLLSASLAIPSLLAINSLAINSLAVCFTCYLFHLLSVSLALSLTCTQASLTLPTLAIKSICYQASLAIKTFAPQSQLLSMLIFYPKLVTIQIRCYENSSCVSK